MTLVNIGKKVETEKHFSLFSIGFRPFFLGACVYSVIAILYWFLVYARGVHVDTGDLTLFQWHAHEMIYGYSMAVISGFLLTAVMNWTGVETVKGKKLIFIFSLWCFARFFFLSAFYKLAFIVDLIYGFLSLYYIAQPIIKVRQWRQLGVLSKIILLTIGNFLFYLSFFGFQTANFSIYFGLYLIVGLILTIGSRVFPSFIAVGLDLKEEISNPLWLSIFGLVLFLCFFVNELFIFNYSFSIFLLPSLFILNFFRLILWHRVRLWTKPLLWSLFLSIVFIDIGFLLLLLSYLGYVSKYIAIHSFAYGGIGLATMGMMARVILGHTGRNVRNPSRATNLALYLLLIGAIFRIVLPALLSSKYYSVLIILAQLFWMLAFLIFIYSNFKMLIKPSMRS